MTALPLDFNPQMNVLPRRRGPVLVMLLSVWLLSQAGCESVRQTPPLGAADYPADFSLVLTVRSQATDGDGSATAYRPAQHLLEPDRLLRVAFGAGTHARYYPPPTARLAPAQVAELYRRTRSLIDQTPKMSGEAGAPAADPGLGPAVDADRVLCQITVTAHRRVTQLTVDPRRSPPAQALLDLLVQLRGGR